jgi:hypothetical protein
MPERPDEEELHKRHRWFAVECNNRSWTLIERPERTADEDDELLLRAHAAAFHWQAIGTEEQRALADLLLAHTHALIGRPDFASRYAGRAYGFFSAERREPWQRAFAEAAMAHAAAVSGRTLEHAAHYQRAGEIGASLGKEDREIFLATFRTIPAPAAENS